MRTHFVRFKLSITAYLFLVLYRFTSLQSRLFLKNIETFLCKQKLMKHLLCMGWRNFFSSCGFVSVFGSGGKQVLILYTYVLRVQYSYGVVLVFLVLVGNSFWCYVRTQCTIQLFNCVSFLVVAGNCSLNETTFLQKKIIGLLYYDPLADVCIS